MPRSGARLLRNMRPCARVWSVLATSTMKEWRLLAVTMVSGSSACAWTLAAQRQSATKKADERHPARDRTAIAFRSVRGGQRAVDEPDLRRHQPFAAITEPHEHLL